MDREAMPEKPKRRDICEAIKRMVASGEFKAGDRFDSERQLARRMHVQRLTASRAIKVLCKEGVLVQRPKSGTFVASGRFEGGGRDVDEQSAEASFWPTTNLMASRKSVEIRFAVDDFLPEQRDGWRRVLAAFNAGRSNVRVDLTVKRVDSVLADYDCALVLPKELREWKSQRQLDVVSNAWFEANPVDSFLPVSLVEDINRLGCVGGGYVAIPVLLTLPVNIIHQARLRHLGVPLLPSRRPWRETQDWMKRLRLRVGSLEVCLFSHSPLSHFARQDRRVLLGGHVELETPEIMSFLCFLKDLWANTMLRAERGAVRFDVWKMFRFGHVHAFEAFLHLAPVVCGSMDCAIALNSVSGRGVSQVLPRYLAFNSKRNNVFELLEFAQFLASFEAQRIIAEAGLGVPYYWGRDGVEFLCHACPMPFGELREELGHAEAFYENVFFSGDFQRKIINSELVNYFTGNVTLKNMIVNVRRRTGQLRRLLGR